MLKSLLLSALALSSFVGLAGGVQANEPARLVTTAEASNGEVRYYRYASEGEAESSVNSFRLRGIAADYYFGTDGYWWVVTNEL